MGEGEGERLEVKMLLQHKRQPVSRPLLWVVGGNGNGMCWETGSTSGRRMIHRHACARPSPAGAQKWKAGLAALRIVRARREGELRELVRNETVLEGGAEGEDVLLCRRGSCRR